MTRTLKEIVSEHNDLDPELMTLETVGF